MSTEIILPSRDGTPQQVALDAAGLTDVGRERDRNEDSFLIATMQRSLTVLDSSVEPGEMREILPASAKGTLLVVADGMGGTGGGDVASRVAVRTVSHFLVNVLPFADSSSFSMRGTVPLDQTLPGVRQGLTSAIARGDSAVRRARTEPGATDRMGTTLTVAYVLWPHLYVAHVGDSRCYLLRGRELKKLTTDHTLAEKMREHTDVTLDESSPWHHVLYNALGGDDAAQVEPEVTRGRLQLDDTLLLCSDGLPKHVSEGRIAEIIARSATAKEACARLVATANADGGSDNITVVVCHASGVSPSEAAPTVRHIPGS